MSGLKYQGPPTLEVATRQDRLFICINYLSYQIIELSGTGADIKRPRPKVFSVSQFPFLNPHHYLSDRSTSTYEGRSSRHQDPPFPITSTDQTVSNNEYWPDNEGAPETDNEGVSGSAKRFWSTGSE